MSESGPRPARRPNILLFFSDDHGYADRGATGYSTDTFTPGLDRIAAEGATCTNGYVTAPMCSPSRAGLMAGSYQQRWGAQWFNDSRMCPESVPTIAELLKKQGYATGYFGKVHYGPEKSGDRGCPPGHGFDESLYGLAGQSMGRLSYLRHSKAAVAEYGDAHKAMGVQPLWDGHEEAELEGFLTEELGSRARDFIGRHQHEPFFAMVAFNAVHNFTFQLPPEELKKRGLPEFHDWNAGESEYIDWYDGAISPNLPDGRAYYLAQLELMDKEIADTLDTLDRLGLAEDTLVLYSTDNGGSVCNYARNEPLRGTKYTLWEGGIRVPYLVRWPGGGVKAGSTVQEPVSTLDYLPTFLSAAGADPTEYAFSDGLDQHAVWAGEPGAHGHGELHWDTGWQWAVRKGDWKLSWVEPGHRIAQSIRNTEHAEPGEGYSLHRLSEDIQEANNLADAEPEKLHELIECHETWRARTLHSYS